MNKGCYTRETGQFRLSNKKELFDSQKWCPRNPFALYEDTETDMKKNKENMGPDYDWDDIRPPQAIELHMKTEYPQIFQKFNIPLHYKVQGIECMKKDVEEYFMLFEKEDKNGISFNKYVKETNNDINPS